MKRTYQSPLRQRNRNGPACASSRWRGSSWSPTIRELNLAKVAKLAGVGAASTYKHFASDEDLFHAVIERVQKEVWDDLGVFEATPATLPEIPLAAFPVY